MSYYSDLLFRPKQAIFHAFEKPSAVRALGLVLLSTLFTTLMLIVLAGQLDVRVLLFNLLGDVIRLLSGGLLLFILGIIFKRIQASSHTFVQGISMLASLSFYAFLILVLLGFIFPVVLAPSLPSSFQDLQSGAIGTAEFQAAVGELFANVSDVTVAIALVLFLIFVLLVLYSIYALYLSISTYLKTTVVWTVIAMVVYLLFTSFLTTIFSTAVGA